MTIAILIRLTFNPLHLPLHLPNANAIPHSLNRNVSIKILFKLKVELVWNVFCILLSFKFNLFIIKNKSARLYTFLLIILRSVIHVKQLLRRSINFRLVISSFRFLCPCFETLSSQYTVSICKLVSESMNSIH